MASHNNHVQLPTSMTSSASSSTTTTTTDAIDPSDMLAAALQQMDGLIAGFENVGCSTTSIGPQFDFSCSPAADSCCNGFAASTTAINRGGGDVGSNCLSCQRTSSNRRASSVEQLLEELVSAIRVSSNKTYSPASTPSSSSLASKPIVSVDSETKAFLVKWLTTSPANQPSALMAQTRHKQHVDVEKLLEDLGLVSGQSAAGTLATSTATATTRSKPECTFMVKIVPSPPQTSRRVKRTNSLNSGIPYPSVAGIRTASPCPPILSNGQQRQSNDVKTASNKSTSFGFKTTSTKNLIPIPIPQNASGGGGGSSSESSDPNPNSGNRWAGSLSSLGARGGAASSNRTPHSGAGIASSTSFGYRSNSNSNNNNNNNNGNNNNSGLNYSSHQRKPPPAGRYGSAGHPVAKANGLSPDYDDLQDKVQRLEGDKENLSLQVSVLHEQIEAQTDKIRDLESALETKKGQLENVEDMLQHGLMTLESQKLDLMSEISNLKLRLTSIEKDKLEMEERYRRAELEVIGLKTQVSEKDREILLLKTQVTGRSPPGMLSSPDVTKSNYHVSPENSLRKVQQRYLEMDKLRKALECVMAANDEKDRRIDELEHAVARYKHVQERVLTSHFRKSNSVTTEEEDANEGILPPSQSPNDLNSKCKDSGDYRVADKPPAAPRAYFTSTSLQPRIESSSSCRGPRSPSAPGSVKSSPGAQRATSFEEIASVPPRTPPSHVRHGVDSYGTIPRKQTAGSNDNNNGQSCFSSKDGSSYRGANNPDLDPFRSRQKSTGMSFGKGFFWLKTGKRSCSAPNLGPTESTDSSPPVPQSPQVLDSRQKPKGIKRIFGKLKRSNSQHLEDAPGEFRRGGVRSTAGPRLAWSRELKGDKESVDVPFAHWDGEKIASWLHDMGLTAYIGDCKRWVKSGDQLLRASNHDLEKELSIKHPLHRKKLQLALQAMGSIDVTDEDLSGALDYVWVTRWLDDVGLPQYKDAFSESRIDGRMLNFMTVEDLFLLKMTNLLHYTSLKRGIQVLRQNNFNPNCLKRRPGSDENGNPSSSSDVVLWTNHRVMEWLRLVDLSEYAPNLRGSGVHGALMIFEPRFNAELLATLLSIPLNKTLLRRHLSTHFKQLVGPDTVKQKREHEASPLYVPITPGIKIKATRRSQFSLMKKRNKNDIEYEDYVCPHDLSINGNSKQLSKTESTKDSKSKVRPTTSNPLNSPFGDKHL